MAAALNFPNSPTDGDIFTAPNGQKWVWVAAGPYWKVYSDNISVGNVSINTTVISVGNSSVNVTINSTSFSGNANNADYLDGQHGAYYTNATNITTGTLPYAQIPVNVVNTTGSFTLGGNTTLAGTNTAITSNVNITGAFLNVASSFVVNSTGGYHTGTINAASHTVGTSFVANSIGITSTGFVNATSVVNSASHTVGTSFIANSTFVYTGNTTSNVTLGYNSTSQAILQSFGSVNSFLMHALWNSNSGTAASGDLAIYTDDGWATGNNFIDMGINSSTWSNAQWTIGGARDGYLYVGGGNLTIGTNSANKYVAFFTDGTLATNERMRINSTAIVVNTGVGLFVNGSLGTANQVLSSNGSGLYWADPGTSSGGVYMKGGTANVGTLAVEGQNIFRVNANTLNYNTTISSGENAQATGPLTVTSGITLTIEAGARVAIV